MTTQKCTDVKFRAFRDIRCPRDAKPNETLCGIHLAAKRRREQNTAKMLANMDAGQAALDRAKAACEALKEHGITAWPHYDTKHTGNVIVKPDEVLGALAFGREQ